MPNKKTISIFVICIAVIVSVWLVAKKQDGVKNLVSLSDKKEASVESVIQIDSPKNDEWKKILTTVDSKKQKVTNLTNTINEEEEVGNTLTDLAARDFLAQYMLAVKNGTPITPDVAKNIVANTLSLPNYNPKAVEYIRDNLKVVQRNDKNTLVKYSQEVNQSLIKVYFSLKDDPMAILLTAIQSESERDLKYLDPIIEVNREVNRKLLAMDVPESAVKVHLDLLNSSSRILMDLEFMRSSIEDPMKIFSVFTTYTEDFDNFKKALGEMNNYFIKNSL